MNQSLKQRCYRALTMLSLILAGETVFLPAFHLGRYFKTSLLATYDLNEVQLGSLGAIYGILATACYFLGGPLADRHSPRKLLAASLVLTALGSLYMATIPSLNGLRMLFGFWGVSTILAFWAPLIRATREWAGEDEQGTAFGILDGGRGLASALIALIAAHAFALFVGDGAIDPLRETTAVKKLVVSYGGYCVFAAICVWFFVPDPKPNTAVSPDRDADETPAGKPNVLRRLVLVLRSPATWLQAIVIIAAYSAFKMIDNYGLYAEDAYDLTPTASAKLIANISFIRVGAALGAGWIADKCLGTRVTIQVCFGMLLAAYAMFLFVAPDPERVGILVGNMVVSCLGFFALRGIYFALLEESGTPRELTGTAVGVISFVGFAPEIFMGPLTGWLILDARNSGDVLVGYHQIFCILSVLSVGGMLAALALRWFGSHKPVTEDDPAKKQP